MNIGMELNTPGLKTIPTQNACPGLKVIGWNPSHNIPTTNTAVTSRNASFVPVTFDYYRWSKQVNGYLTEYPIVDKLTSDEVADVRTILAETINETDYYMPTVNMIASLNYLLTTRLAKNLTSTVNIHLPQDASVNGFFYAYPTLNVTISGFYGPGAIHIYGGQIVTTNPYQINKTKLYLLNTVGTPNVMFNLINNQAKIKFSKISITADKYWSTIKAKDSPKIEVGDMFLSGDGVAISSGAPTTNVIELDNSKLYIHDVSFYNLPAAGYKFWWFYLTNLSEVWLDNVDRAYGVYGNDIGFLFYISGSTARLGDYNNITPIRYQVKAGGQILQ